MGRLNTQEMSSDEDWDIEHYKSEHESEEHWELRRKFLLTHKGKFSEDELICLAQVFVNVELLGCRYPKETMQVIAELAKGVADDFRNKQKNKLQRTFVAASDAASSKVKGTTAPKSTHLDRKEVSEKNTKLCNKREFREEGKHFTKRRRVEELPYGDIVLVERPGDIPQNILACAANVSGGNLEWKFERDNDKCKCIVLLDSKQLAEASAINQKAAKKEAAVNALKELQKYYYTIKVKYNISQSNTVTTTTMLKNSESQEGISNDNIGMRLMKLMGWSGGGLGKSEQGMVEPVTVKQQINKEGLGLKSGSSNTYEIKMRSKDLMRKYLAGNMKDDLVFSADFTNEERAVIHQVARQMGLKSHSYGPKTQRTLVVCRKIDVHELVEELKSLGKTTDKYQLIEPTIL